MKAENEEVYYNKGPIKVAIKKEGETTNLIIGVSNSFAGYYDKTPFLSLYGYEVAPGVRFHAENVINGIIKMLSLDSGERLAGAGFLQNAYEKHSRNVALLFDECTFEFKWESDLSLNEEIKSVFDGDPGETIYDLFESMKREILRRNLKARDEISLELLGRSGASLVVEEAKKKTFFDRKAEYLREEFKIRMEMLLLDVEKEASKIGDDLIEGEIDEYRHVEWCKAQDLNEDLIGPGMAKWRDYLGDAIQAEADDNK